MAKYYVNNGAQPNGDHEVHKEGCSWLPLIVSKTYLGDFTNCHDAVRAAKSYHSQVNGCKYCAAACHTG